MASNSNRNSHKYFAISRFFKSARSALSAVLVTILTSSSPSVAAKTIATPVWEEANRAGRQALNKAHYAEAEKSFTAALKSAEGLGEEHPCVVVSLNNLALLYDEQGKYQEAEPLYKRSLSLLEPSPVPSSDVATVLNNQAGLFSKQADYAEADVSYKRALAIRERTFGPKHPKVATSLNNLATLHCLQSKFKEALEAIKVALIEKSELNFQLTFLAN
jgi:tetratricopeptide (TPR) repeat protein